jgi:hypothetical protein
VLKDHSDDPLHGDDAYEFLERLRSRNDIVYEIAVGIDAFVAERASASAPTGSGEEIPASRPVRRRVVSVEMTGNTVEAAKAAALHHLGVNESDVEFEILAEPQTGLFGRLRTKAEVRARVRPTAPRAD